MEEQDPFKKEMVTFLKNIQTISNPEEKLRASLSFMSQALVHKENPNLKGFWEARRLCLPLFKEPLSGSIRSKLWTDYIELTREGRRLKNLLSIESAFAVKQIDIAILSLEDEVNGFHAQDKSDFKDEPRDFHFSKEPQSLKERSSFYCALQNQLNTLHVHASRINSLRKELIITDMRVRQKNEFFNRLSSMGDLVFPLRKDLICQISEAFVKDVSSFVEVYLSDEASSYEKILNSLFFLREEIKSFQAMAKVLTLNTHAFSLTREQLSGFWDKLKGMEKEWKKELINRKQKSRSNRDQVQERIEKFISDYAQAKYTLEEGKKELEAIHRWMREVELNRNDVLFLKENLVKARNQIENEENKIEEHLREQQEQLKEANREKIKKFQEEIESLAEQIEIEKPETLSTNLISSFETYRKKLSTIPMMKAERQRMEGQLKTIREQLMKKQEEALLLLSSNDRETLDNLKNILSQRKERRKMIKHQIEEYRKISSGSNLDFEKAMHIQELMNGEKASLSELDQSISEIEKKIRQFTGSY
ncbi:MAG: hypothetical protein R3E91_05000 [Chlamydiales bacterium]